MLRFKFNFAIAVVLSLLTLGASVLAQNKPLKKIRVGVPSVGMGNIIIFVTKEGRLFEKYGLDAEVITVMGSGIGSKALISGNLDIIPIATPTVIAANLAGADMAILAHTMPAVVHALMVRPEIKKPEDLKGKKIGVSSLGSLTDFLVRSIAKKKGLNPDRDITLVTTGGSDTERVMALKAGAVEATAVSHPGYGLARKMGYGQGAQLSMDGNHHAPGGHQKRSGTDHKLHEGAPGRHRVVQNQSRFRHQGHQKVPENVRR